MPYDTGKSTTTGAPLGFHERGLHDRAGHVLCGSDFLKERMPSRLLAFLAAAAPPRAASPARSLSAPPLPRPSGRTPPQQGGSSRCGQPERFLGSFLFARMRGPIRLQARTSAVLARRACSRMIDRVIVRVIARDINRLIGIVIDQWL